MPITVNVESAQANLYQYLNQLDDGSLDKVIVQDAEVDLFEIVTEAVFTAADSAGAADAEIDVVSAYSGSPATDTTALYKLIKNMRNRQAAPDAQKGAGTITTVAKAAMNDSVAATGTITTVAGGSLVDGETFTLEDTLGNVVVFEFDDNASVSESPTLRQVVFGGGDSADTVRDTIITAITGSALEITASDGGAATVSLVQDNKTTSGNNAILETVANTGFVVAGFTGGTEPETVTLTTADGTVVVFEFDEQGDGVEAGNIQVDISGDTSGPDIAVTLGGVLDANGFVTDVSTNVVTVTQVDPGTGGNTAIGETVADGSFLVTGFAGGTDADVSGGVIGLKNSKNDTDVRAYMVPSDHAAAIGL